MFLFLVSVLLTGPSYVWLILQNTFTISFCCFLFAAWQQTCCSVSVHAYLLSVSRSMVVLLINFNISTYVAITSTVIGKTLQHVGRCYGLQQLVSHNVG